MKIVKKEKMQKTTSNKGKKTNQELISDNIILSDDYRKRLYNFFNIEDAREISRMLNDRTKPLKANVGSYRQVNSWDKYGLFDIDREGGEWRKYSVMDSLWLNIIYELRCLDFSIEKIKIVKTTLEESKNKTASQMPSLEFCAFLSLMEKTQTFLLVFRDGSAMPLTINEYNLNIINGKLKNHIVIDINEILLRQFYNNEKMKPVYEIFFIQPEKIRKSKKKKNN